MQMHVGSRQMERQVGEQAGGCAVGQVGIQVGRKASFEPAPEASTYKYGSVCWWLKKFGSAL